MNKENSGSGSSCSVSCPEYYGSLPSCAGLAVPYVPFQGSGPEIYAQEDALSNGTLYPSLNLPFHLAVDGSDLPAGPLVELQALEFVTLELGLYLDTHPDDTEAFTLFKQYSAMEKAAKSAYETRYGALTKCASAAGERYDWLKGPWPWHYQKNEVK